MCSVCWYIINGKIFSRLLLLINISKEKEKKNYTEKFLNLSINLYYKKKMFRKFSNKIK